MERYNVLRNRSPNELIVKYSEYYEGKLPFVEITEIRRTPVHLVIGLDEWREIVEFIEEQVTQHEEEAA